MAKYLLDLAITIILFLFLWKAVGKPLIRWTARPSDSIDAAPKATIEELRAAKAKLTERIAKLKDKAEIAKLREKLNDVNEQLADLA